MKRLRFHLILLIGLLSASPVLAQDCDPQQDPFCEDPDNGVPLDGGVGLLIGAAAAYGIKKLKERHNEE